jgi:hypothetical protein
MATCISIHVANLETCILIHVSNWPRGLTPRGQNLARWPARDNSRAPPGQFLIIKITKKKKWVASGGSYPFISLPLDHSLTPSALDLSLTLTDSPSALSLSLTLTLSLSLSVSVTHVHTDHRPSAVFSGQLPLWPSQHHACTNLALCLPLCLSLSLYLSLSLSNWTTVGTTVFGVISTSLCLYLSLSLSLSLWNLDSGGYYMLTNIVLMQVQFG